MVSLPSLWTCCRTAVWVVFLTLLTGCATDPASKKVDEDPLAKQARRMRANSTAIEGTGFDPRAREIEKDLGCR